MSFTMDDVMEVLQIVKECKDAELHIESGDLKLSIFKGNIGDSARGPVNFSSPACQASQPGAVAAPAAGPLGFDSGPSAPVPVPEAAVDEHDLSVSREHDVGGAGEGADMDAEAVAGVVHAFARAAHP